MIRVEKERISIPESVLVRVSEITPEGFFLFYMGSDGEPEFVSTAQNSVIGRGIVSFAQEELDAGLKNDKKKHEIFKESLTLGKLEEHTLGGFLLIFVDSGEPCYIFSFDSNLIKRGITSFARDILKGLRFVEENEYSGNFIRNGDSEDESFSEG